MVTIVRTRSYPYGLALYVALKKSNFFVDKNNEFADDLARAFVFHEYNLRLTEADYSKLLGLCEENNISPTAAFSVI